jgi:hypothetical protein
MLQLKTFNDLSSRLRKIEEIEYLDLQSERSAVITSIEKYQLSRYELGKALTSYKSHLNHGSWMSASAIIEKSLAVSERTLRDLMLSYRNTLRLDKDRIEDLRNAGIGPSSSRGQRIIVALLESDDLSTDEAIALTDRTSVPALSKQEHRKVAVREALQSLLVDIPSSSKLATISEAVAEAVYDLIGPVSAFTITRWNFLISNPRCGFSVTEISPRLKSTSAHEQNAASCSMNPVPRKKFHQM